MDIYQKFFQKNNGLLFKTLYGNSRKLRTVQITYPTIHFNGEEIKPANDEWVTLYKDYYSKENLEVRKTNKHLHVLCKWCEQETVTVYSFFDVLERCDKCGRTNPLQEWVKKTN